MSTTSRLQAARTQAEMQSLRAMMALPERVQRALAGPPLTLDGQTLAVDTQLMLKVQRLTREPVIESLPIAEGRPAALRQTALAGGVQPIGSVRDLVVGGPADNSEIPARLYVPTGAPARGPLLVFFHGGGFFFGDLETHDASCRFLAERSGVRVLAVDYRLGPEQRFPAAHDDALAAYRWAREHADELGADVDRMAVGGDSAGGNLAAATAISAAQEGLPLAFQLLIYPATDGRHDTASATMFDKGLFLTRAFLDLAGESALPAGHDVTDPRFSPLYADVPPGLAPAYVATAGFDPLRDEGEAYARKLADAGVTVELRRFTDQIHGFLNVVGVGRTAVRATTEIAARLAAAL